MPKGQLSKVPWPGYNSRTSCSLPFGRFSSLTICTHTQLVQHSIHWCPLWTFFFFFFFQFLFIFIYLFICFFILFYLSVQGFLQSTERPHQAPSHILVYYGCRYDKM